MKRPCVKRPLRGMSRSRLEAFWRPVEKLFAGLSGGFWGGLSRGFLEACQEVFWGGLSRGFLKACQEAHWKLPGSVLGGL